MIDDARHAAIDDRVRTFLDAMPTLVWICDADGMCDYLNARWYAYTGAAVRHEGLAWLEAVHPDDRRAVEDAWLAAMRDEATYDMSYRLRAADGSYRWFAARGYPMRRPDGSIARWIGRSTDIDEPKRSREAMRFLSEAGELLGSSLDVHSTLTSLARSCIEQLADYCGVYVSANGGFEPVALAHRDPERVALARALLDAYPIEVSAEMAAVLQAGTSLFSPVVTPEQLRAAARDERHHAMIVALGMHSSMLVPLRARDRVLGFMHVVSAESERTFTHADLTLTELLAKRAAVAIDNAHLYEAARTSAARLKFLADASEALGTSLDLDSTLHTLSRIVVPEFADWSVIYLVDPDGRAGPLHTYHPDPAYAEHVRQLDRERADCREQRVVTYANAEERARAFGAIGVTPHGIAAIEALGCRSQISVPLIVDGRVRGMFSAFRAQAGLPYDEADSLLFSELARRAASAIANAEVYARERRVADTLQRALLPSSLPQIPNLRLSATYVPGESEANVGGDWFDAFVLPDGRAMVSIGDVTGRGLGAAVTMGKARQAIETLAQFESDPSRLLDAVDGALRRSNPDAIVTAAIGVIDVHTGAFGYATAGHPPPFLRAPDGTIVTLPARGLPLGLRGDVESPTTTVNIPPGSVLVLYTDGLTEFSRDVAAGERAVATALADAELAGAPDAAERLLRAVIPDGAHDDVAIVVVGFELREAPVATPWTTRWCFDATDAKLAHEVRDIYMRFLRRRCRPDEDFDGAELIFGELIGNVVRHAPGPVEIELEWLDRRPVLHVYDSGPGYEAQCEDLPSSIFAESGRGLYLIESLSAEFTLARRAGRGTHARAVLRCTQA